MWSYIPDVLDIILAYILSDVSNDVLAVGHATPPGSPGHAAAGPG